MGFVMLNYIFNDGGRSEAGLAGNKHKDCVVRAIAIAAQLPYSEVRQALEACNAGYRGKYGRSEAIAKSGVWTNGAAFKRYMASIGWRFVATMGIGTGCTVHLRAGELPMGRLIVSVSRHYTAVIDGVIHDTHNPARDGNRCVYGYWIKA